MVPLVICGVERFVLVCGVWRFPVRLNRRPGRRRKKCLRHHCIYKFEYSDIDVTTTCVCIRVHDDLTTGTVPVGPVVRCSDVSRTWILGPARCMCVCVYGGGTHRRRRGNGARSLQAVKQFKFLNSDSSRIPSQYTVPGNGSTVFYPPHLQI